MFPLLQGLPKKHLQSHTKPQIQVISTNVKQSNIWNQIFHIFRESHKGEYHEQEVEEITKPQLPQTMSASDILDQQVVDNEENPDYNEIPKDYAKRKRSSSLYSM